MRLDAPAAAPVGAAPSPPVLHEVHFADESKDSWAVADDAGDADEPTEADKAVVDSFLCDFSPTSAPGAAVPVVVESA